MKVIVTILAILVIMFACSHNRRANAGTFYPNKPSCTTTCVKNGNVTTCNTVCSGGTN